MSDLLTDVREEVDVPGHGGRNTQAVSGLDFLKVQNGNRSDIRGFVCDVGKDGSEFHFRWLPDSNHIALTVTDGGSGVAGGLAGGLVGMCLLFVWCSI